MKTKFDDKDELGVETVKDGHYVDFRKSARTSAGPPVPLSITNNLAGDPRGVLPNQVALNAAVHVSR
jgi:hypothetical protein